jgi:two-component system response regulator DesR
VPRHVPGGAPAEVIRRVHGGGRYVDPALAADALTASPCPLTQRGAGDVAGRGPKLGVASRVEAFRVAHDMGWL